MVIMETKNFRLSQIWQSGQCFRMTQTGEDTFEIIAGDRFLAAEQTGTTCRFYCSEEEFGQFWESYFDLKNDYRLYIEEINPRDHYLKASADFGSGIRILKQDLWEMIVSFLISQQNHITRIRKCIQNICETYGKEMETSDGKKYYAFPIDTHISQALEKHYKRGFPNRRYHGFRGVMQQYIFYYELMGPDD